MGKRILLLLRCQLQRAGDHALSPPLKEKGDRKIRDIRWAA